MEWIADPTAWLGLATLIVLEIVLGIDNLVFIAILADKLPPHLRVRFEIRDDETGRVLAASRDLEEALKAAGVSAGAPALANHAVYPEYTAGSEGTSFSVFTDQVR